MLALSLLLTVTVAASNDLRGVVVDDASTNPVAGAHVYVYYAFPKVGVSALCASCYRDCGKREMVDAKGAFRIAGLDPTLVFDVLAVADGYEPVFARKIDPKSGSVTIRMTPRSTTDADRLITGTVHDPEGRPIVGAIVEPNGYTFELNGRSVTGYGSFAGLDKLSVTNGKGEFALRMPTATGKLDVRVTAPGLAPRMDRLLLPGQPRRISLAPGATISGRIQQDGKPVAGVPVRFEQQLRYSQNYLGRSEIATNEDGLFVMASLAPNEAYVVSASIEGGVIEPKVVKTGASETSVDAGLLMMGPGRRIAGTVVHPSGSPVPPKTEVLLDFRNVGIALRTELGSDGQFVFETVPSGRAILLLPRYDAPTSPRSSWFDPDEEEIVIPTEGDCTDLQVLLWAK